MAVSLPRAASKIKILTFLFFHFVSCLFQMERPLSNCHCLLDHPLALQRSLLGWLAEVNKSLQPRSTPMIALRFLQFLFLWLTLTLVLLTFTLVLLADTSIAVSMASISMSLSSFPSTLCCFNDRSLSSSSWLVRFLLYFDVLLFGS